MNPTQSKPPQGSSGQSQRSALAGKYQLLATLGQGGMADVYLAVARGPLGFNKLVVLKRLRAHVEDEGQTLQMFLDEARLAARLNHPNIVDTYDVGREADSYFIAMEYLDGQPLSRVLKTARRANPNPTVWVHIVAEALHGLQHAHELRDYDGTPLQIVHRDVSPHNIFVTYEAEVKVVDFGIAKATLNVAQTEAGLLKGKIGYMPPEQALGQEVDRRADIFSTGVVLWEALAGRRLLEGGMATVFAKLVHSEVPKLLEVNPEIDPRLAEIVDRALKKRPAERFATAADMREALLDYLRRTPQAATKSDVGRMMSAAFGEQRASVQKEIEKHLANAVRGLPHQGSFWDSTKMLAAPETSLSGLTGTPSGQGAPEVRTATALISPSLSAGGSVTNAAAATTVPQPELLPVRSSRGKVIAILAGIAVAGVGGAIVAMRYEHKAAAPATTSTATALPVTIESEPSGAFISWNGQTMGHTPLTFDLPRGVQTLIVSKQGFSTEPVVLDLNDGNGRVSRIVTLKADPEIAVPANAAAPGPTHHSFPSASRTRPRHEGAERSSRVEAPEPIAAAPRPEPEPAPAPPPAPPAPIVEATPAPPPAEPAPAPAPTPTLAPGSIDAKAVGAVVGAHKGEIQACMERARMDHADLHGKLTVQATVSPAGKVLSTSANSTIENGARLQSCVLSSLQSWTFPAPAGGVNGTVTKVFLFE